MPELPEVEIVRRGLAGPLVGKRVIEVEQRRPDLRFPFPERFGERLAGQMVVALARRAKYILAEFERGDVLIIHLGMTGRLTLTPPASGDRATLASYVYDTGCHPEHDHVLFRLSGGDVVTYNDPRRFGFMLLTCKAELAQHPMLHHLGVEPLGADFDAAYLARQAQGRRTDLKAFLLDQRVIAGLGNIYVCEALFRARLSPLRKAHTLSGRGGAVNARGEALAGAIRQVLQDAIAAGGSTLRDYRHADGEKGAFQERFSVYDREAEACGGPGCGGFVRRIVQAGRSSFYCPRCQR